MARLRTKRARNRHSVNCAVQGRRSSYDCCRRQPLLCVRLVNLRESFCDVFLFGTQFSNFLNRATFGQASSSSLSNSLSILGSNLRETCVQKPLRSATSSSRTGPLAKGFPQIAQSFPELGPSCWFIPWTWRRKSFALSRPLRSTGFFSGPPFNSIHGSIPPS